MRWVAVICALTVVTVGAVWAQDASLGTPNLKSPNALGDTDFRATIDWRYWNGSNDTFTGAAEYGLSDRLDIGAAYVSFDNSGKDPLGGVVRASDLHGPAVWAKYVGRTVGENRWGWSIVPGVEFLDLTGTNTATGASAGDQETVFTLEVPVGIPDGDVLWIIDPKLAVFPDTEPVTGPIGISLPASVDSYGTILGLGLGVVGPIGTGGHWHVYGDVTPILAGDNSLDPDTNGLTIQLPWTAGVRRSLDLGDAAYLDLFVSNCSGGTTATSLIAAPDRSVGWGARAGVTW